MKISGKIARPALIFICTILMFILPAGCTCLPRDPGTWFTVDNKTDQELGIYIDKLHSVDIPPQEVSRFITTSVYPSPDVYPADKKFLIEAKTKSGEVIYTEEYTWQELDDMNWKITIPFLTKSLGSSNIGYY